jgi:hypothetical protein
VVESADAPPVSASGAEVAFEMTEFSVLDEPEGSELLWGDRVYCRETPCEQVKKYPALRSKRPWYGEAVFGRVLGHPNSGQTYHFVIDEWGQPSKPESGGKDQSWWGKLGDVLSGKAEKEETEKAEPVPARYDRLYFDLNGDLDLTNDPPLVPQRNPPAKAIPSWSAKQSVVFSKLSLPVDFGPLGGRQPFPILPRFDMGESDGQRDAEVFFLALTARRGTIRIGSQEHTAVLGQPSIITGRFDLPSTYLTLEPALGPEDWEGTRLGAMRWVGGRFYTLRASPSGDKLFVEPYQGEFGAFRIGPGSRNLEKLAMSGTLCSPTASVMVGKYSEEAVEEAKVEECRLPIGDYLPSDLRLNYGRLRIRICQNYHLDGKRRAILTRRWIYGIKVRKDEPFVLDFSNKPEVLFASPGRDKTFHPGDEVRVNAVLIDPVLDIMIRNLYDASRKEKKTVKHGTEETTVEQGVSLDPTVTITDSSGKTVAKGTMPFG